MNSDHSSGTSASTVLLAVLGGAILGAGIALLYAPQSGRRTREKLKGLGEDAEDYALELWDKAGESLGKVELKGEKWAQEIQEYVADKKRQLAGAMDGAKSGR
jgi:gas vesicle protein